MNDTKVKYFCVGLFLHNCVTGVTANVTVGKYPLGTHLWRISGGDGCDSEDYSSMLTLSTCNDTQFACDDGLCVDMITR